MELSGSAVQVQVVGACVFGLCQGGEPDHRSRGFELVALFWLALRCQNDPRCFFGREVDVVRQEMSFEST